MKETLKQSLDLLAENREMIGEAFNMDSPYMWLIAAMDYSAKGCKADVERMKQANELIKKKVGMFSEFKGNVKLALIVQMAQTDRMEELFDHIQTVYKMLSKGNPWCTPDYYIIAAMVIAQRDNVDSMTDEQCVEKTKSIYANMKKNHPWLTGSEDVGFAALLAVSGLEVSVIDEEMEACYKYLKEKKVLGSSNVIQSLSQVLALQTGDVQEKCDRIIALYNNLKDQKKKYSGSEICVLGQFAFTDLDVQAVGSEIAEADDYLKTKKAFNPLVVSGSQRLMYASIFVMQQYCPKADSINAAALAGSVSLLIAEHTTLMIVMLNGMVLASQSHS